MIKRARARAARAMVLAMRLVGNKKGEGITVKAMATRMAGK